MTRLQVKGLRAYSRQGEQLHDEIVRPGLLRSAVVEGKDDSFGQVPALD